MQWVFDVVRHYEKEFQQIYVVFDEIRNTLSFSISYNVALLDAKLGRLEAAIYDLGEIVRQLHDNWFLIYSPQSQMAPIVCANGTHADRHIPSGVSRLFVSSDCSSQLKNHLLISDISLRVVTDLMHFEWTWNDDSLFRH
jgi:hypothetical protein